MAYDQETPGQPPAADGLEAGGSDMPKGDGAQEQAEPIHIQSDMLPQGIKEGDMLKCTGMDENGCQFELVKGEATPEPSWEDKFRADMSPQNPTEEAS